MKDPLRDCMDAALTLLKFQGRSEKEMGERLAKKRFPPEVAAATVGRLKELRLLDDEGLARRALDSFRRAGRGELRIRQDLWKRGVPRDIIARVLAEEPGDGPSPAGGEKARAEEALARRLKRLKTEGLDEKTLYRRLGGWLARQGFPPDVVHETVMKLLSMPAEE